MPQRLAQHLIARGLLPAATVDGALRRMQREGGHLDTALLETGQVSEAGVLQALSDVSGVRLVNLADFEPNTDAAPLMPLKMAKQLVCVPLSVDGKALHVACAYPMPAAQLKDMGFLLGRTLELWVAIECRIRDWQRLLYGEALDARYEKLLGQLDPTRPKPKAAPKRADPPSAPEPEPPRAASAGSAQAPILLDKPKTVRASAPPPATRTELEAVPVGDDDAEPHTSVMDVAAYSQFAKSSEVELRFGEAPPIAEHESTRVMDLSQFAKQAAPSAPPPAVTPAVGLSFPGGVLPPRSAPRPAPASSAPAPIPATAFVRASSARAAPERLRHAFDADESEAPTPPPPPAKVSAPRAPPKPAPPPAAPAPRSSGSGLRGSASAPPRAAAAEPPVLEAELVSGAEADFSDVVSEPPTPPPPPSERARHEMLQTQRAFPAFSVDRAPEVAGVASPRVSNPKAAPAPVAAPPPPPPPPAPPPPAPPPKPSPPPPPVAAPAPEPSPAAAEVAEEPVTQSSPAPQADVPNTWRAESPLLSGSPSPTPTPAVPSNPLDWTLGHAKSALKLASRDREALIAAVLDYARRTFEYAASFAVWRGAAFGWDMRGDGDPLALRDVAIPLDAASIFRTVALTRGSYVGPLPPDTLSQHYLAQLGRAPRTVFVWPVEVQSRLVALIYGDCGARPVSQRRLADFILFCRELPNAFHDLIVFRKQNPKAPDVAQSYLPQEVAATHEPGAEAPSSDGDWFSGLISLLTGPDPAERSTALMELLKTPHLSAQALAQAFPGPTGWSRLPVIELPDPDELGPVPGALARLGDAGAIALAPLLDHQDSDTRYLALLTAGSFRHAAVIDGVVRGLYDFEPDISSAARAAASALKALPSFHQRMPLLRQELMAKDPLRKSLAARALGVLHDRDAVDALINLVGSEDQLCATAAADALKEITRAAHGTNVRAWTAWWARGRDRRRIEWLVDALAADDFDLRLAAIEELSRAFGDTWGYFADAPAPERARALAYWRAFVESRQDLDV